MKRSSSDLLLLSKFKLYLVEYLENEVLPNGLNITDVIADYLRMLHAHVCAELSKGFASNYDQSKFRYVSNSILAYVYTVLFSLYIYISV